MDSVRDFSFEEGALLGDGAPSADFVCDFSLPRADKNAGRCRFNINCA